MKNLQVYISKGMFKCDDTEGCDVSMGYVSDHHKRILSNCCGWTRDVVLRVI